MRYPKIIIYLRIHFKEMVFWGEIENTFSRKKKRKSRNKRRNRKRAYCSRRPTHSGPVNQRSQQVYTRQTAKDKIFGVTSCKRLPRLKGREKRQDGRVTRLIPCSSPRPRRWFFFFLVFFPRRDNGFSCFRPSRRLHTQWKQPKRC